MRYILNGFLSFLALVVLGTVLFYDEIVNHFNIIPAAVIVAAIMYFPVSCTIKYIGKCNDEVNRAIDERLRVNSKMENETAEFKRRAELFDPEGP